jgi:hypothetical protein
VTSRTRPRRIPVTEESPLAPRQPDYADAFEVSLRHPDMHTAEQWARAALEQAPATIRWVIRTVHTYVLRLRLGPMSARDHVLGWRIAESTSERIQLEASSPVLGRGVIVGHRLSPTRVVVTTFLYFDRPRAGRLLWAIVGPLHRLIAPLLLQRARGAFDS